MAAPLSLVIPQQDEGNDAHFLTPTFDFYTYPGPTSVVVALDLCPLRHRQ